LANIKENIKTVADKIRKSAERHGRKVQDIKLIAVSKTFTVSDMKTAYDAGQIAFGESYPQELRDKLPELEDSGIKPELHFIGNLQRNKAKYVVGNVYLIHSVGSIKLLKEINKLALKKEVNQKCLLQFNISGEESKGGFESIHIEDILSEAEGLNNIIITGVMGISGLESNDDEREAEFRRMVEISNKLKSYLPEAIEISMGMSGDYDLAIANGSTMLRIGSAIFGQRDYTK
jgi:pyridoxal phosphate enzyme (YggS family)